MAKQRISYILPVYNEEANLKAFHTELKKVTKSLSKQYTFELLFINDGSKDASLSILTELQKKDTSIMIIDFARNYGHQLALTAGIDHATGDALIIMDTDLQDPPKVSAQLIEKWEQGFDVVYAQRNSRKDSWFKKISADLFYRLLQQIAEVEIPKDTGDFRLINRAVADQVRNFREHNRFMRGIVSYVGFTQTAVRFDRDQRFAGKTHYPLRAMVRLAKDGIIGFSTTPLKVISRMGYFIAFLSVVAILYVLYVRIFTPHVAVEGWAFTVISIFFVGGVQLIMLGVLGGYIARIYREVQGRPLYGVRSIYRINANNKKT
jgi:glycosyltransferase involved in cell wall biosynthesis